MTTSTDEIIHIPLNISFRTLAHVREIFHAVSDVEQEKNILPPETRSSIISDIKAVLAAFDNAVAANQQMCEIMNDIGKYSKNELPDEMVDSFSEEHSTIFTVTAPQASFVMYLLTGYYNACRQAPIIDESEKLTIQMVMTNVLDFLQQIFNYVDTI